MNFFISKKINSTISEKKIVKFRHNYYPISQLDIEQAFISFDLLPIELNLFYQEIGFGYFHCNEEPGEAVYEFVIDGRPENTPITTKGRYAGVYYYEVSFKTDESGKLHMKVGDKLKVRRGGL